MSTLTKRFGLAVLLAAVSSSCTLKDTDPPPLTGPSEFAMRVGLSLVPDSILQDGLSQTTLNIEVTGGDGRAVRGMTLHIALSEGGVIYDAGTLSAKTVVTGDDGRARAIYTSPPRQQDGAGTVVTFLVTPVGNDFRGQEERTIDLQLLQPGVIQPPNAAPVARFTFSPSTVTALSTVIFDASTSADVNPATGAEFPCGATCTFSWDFGDGTTGTGVFTTHEFRRVGTFPVRLTVTDSRGASGQTAQPITIGPTTPPTAAFTFSPTAPAVSQPISFNAITSRPAPGRTLVSYEWDFGSGRTASGVSVSKAYDTAGTYSVTLTVTDDAGQSAIATQPVTVGGVGTGPRAALSVSPTGGTATTVFTFDASGSNPGPSPIVEYRFNFGDATPEVVGTSPTTTHRYLIAGSYTARVTIRDSANRTAIATVAVMVQ